MDIVCPSCGKVTTISQKYQYHAGHGNQGFLYNDSYSAILEFDPYYPRYKAIVGNKNPWSLNEKEKRRVEDALKPYEKGGRFRFSAYPRCPICNSPLLDLLKGEMYYVEIGEVVDGNREEVWF